MFLANVNDSIQVLADSGSQTVDCFASWKDEDSTVGRSTQPGHAKVALTSTGAAALVASPGRNNVREIEFLSLKAKISNSASVTVRVQVVDALTTTTYDLFSAPLAPGDCLQYHKARGFYLTPASGYAPTTADLVQQFVDAINNPSPNLPT